MSTIEEAREQARAALELIHKWRQREQAWDTPRALDFERIGVSIRALLDATEPPEIQYADSATVAGLAEKIAGENAELMDRLAVKPAEDEREALTTLISATTYQAAWGECVRAADAILAAGYSKGPRPITDEMVDAAAGADFEFGKESMTWADWGRANPEHAEWLRTKARAILEAAEGARR